MKKSVSLMLAAAMLVTMLSVSALPASAAKIGSLLSTYISDTGGSIVECDTSDGIVMIYGSGNYTISQDCTLQVLYINSEGATLTIVSGVTVTVLEMFHLNSGNVNLYGSLDIQPAAMESGMVTGTEKINICRTGGLKNDNTPGSESTPIECEPQNGMININDPGNYIISQNADVLYLMISNSNATLTIANGKRVKVDTYFSINSGTLVLNGTLDISSCVVTEGTDKISVGGTGHLIGGSSLGSTLSAGNLAIITAVGGLAVGFVAAMIIFKKKKPAPAGVEKEEE